MNGNYIFDTNILIDYLNGIPEAKQTLEHYQGAISIITYFEVIVGVSNEHQERVKTFLNNFSVLNFEEKMADDITHIKQKNRLKLPDAMILATAKMYNAKLITRNTKDFNSISNVVIPYQI